MSVLAPISIMAFQAHAEVVEVEGQGDCPGGNEGWQRHLIVDIAQKRTYTRCVRVETVQVTPTPTPTPTPSPSPSSSSDSSPAPAPESVSRVAGATDPYPNIATGGEVPGTRIWSTSETSWTQFYNNTNSANWRCPVIYGPNGDPYAGESNGFDSSTGKWFRVCVKNPWREPILKSVQTNYELQKSTAMAEALAKSQAWNAENPGKQKCFQWGPITSPSGGTESGGVCANPVGNSSGNSNTDTSTSATLSETRTVAIAVVSAIANTESRTISAANLLKTFSVAEKENLLDVTLKSTKSTVINVSTDIPNIKMVITATKPGWKPIVFTVKTNNQGDSKLTTSKNLTGFTVTLAVNGLKLDSDKAIKK
jgi:hypothetical protein